MASLGAFTGDVVEQVIVNDIETIALQFQKNFSECVKNVQKPNVLVAGVTGAGKSSLVNAVFGSNVAKVGDGMPVTLTFSKIEPPDKPVVVYDSKGLESGNHVEFIEQTKEFFNELRSKQQLQDHIHVVWYVVNAACGRFEPFEVKLIEEVFAPTPVVIVLNKADVASADQLKQLEQLILGKKLKSFRGMFRIVANRSNFSQSWCTKCSSDDVTFKKSTNQLFCDECDHVEVLSQKYGFPQLIETTALLLPDLAKEAFLFSQVESLQQKDRRAKELVKQYASNISMDVSGKALDEVGDMVGRLFILWGWNFLGFKISNSLMQEMREEYHSQELSVRLAMIAADTILKRKLSRSVIACLGLMVNKPLRQLSEQLLMLVEKNGAANAPEVISQFQFNNLDCTSEEFADSFMKASFEIGIEQAIERYWYE